MSPWSSSSSMNEYKQQPGNLFAAILRSDSHTCHGTHSRLTVSLSVSRAHSWKHPCLLLFVNYVTDTRPTDRLPHKTRAAARVQWLCQPSPRRASPCTTAKAGMARRSSTLFSKTRSGRWCSFADLGTTTQTLPAMSILYIHMSVYERLNEQGFQFFCRRRTLIVRPRWMVARREGRYGFLRSESDTCFAGWFAGMGVVVLQSKVDYK